MGPTTLKGRVQRLVPAIEKGDKKALKKAESLVGELDTLRMRTNSNAAHQAWEEASRMVDNAAYVGGLD